MQYSIWNISLQYITYNNKQNWRQKMRNVIHIYFLSLLLAFVMFIILNILKDKFESKH